MSHDTSYLTHVNSYAHNFKVIYNLFLFVYSMEKDSFAATVEYTSKERKTPTRQILFSSNRVFCSLPNNNLAHLLGKP